MNRKEKINYLINEYEKGNYTTEIFCDQFVCVLYYEEDDSINEVEYQQLSQYAYIFARYSNVKEDIKAGFVFDEERIKVEFKKLINTWRDSQC